MFPGKGDLFLLKWKVNIVPKLLKMSAMKDPTVFPASNSNDGKLLFLICALLFMDRI